MPIQVVAPLSNRTFATATAATSSPSPPLPQVVAPLSNRALAIATAATSSPSPLLPQVVASLGNGAVAVATAATASSSRVVVDEYVADSKAGGFKLTSMANDLLTYLHK